MAAARARADFSFERHVLLPPEEKQRAHGCRGIRPMEQHALRDADARRAIERLSLDPTRLRERRYELGVGGDDADVDRIALEVLRIARTLRKGRKGGEAVVVAKQQR